VRSCSGAIQRDAATQVLPDCVYPLWHPVSLNLVPPPEQSELTTEQEEQIPFDGQKLSEYPEPVVPEFYYNKKQKQSK